uniref:(northern house mosquito) hypothetical protein n=1 Tax=Culex pipiens TaxID=7175 RepID=A0A8D8GF05_CULPI
MVGSLRVLPAIEVSHRNSSSSDKTVPEAVFTRTEGDDNIGPPDAASSGSRIGVPPKSTDAHLRHCCTECSLITTAWLRTVSGWKAFVFPGSVSTFCAGSGGGWAASVVNRSMRSFCCWTICCTALASCSNVCIIRINCSGDR